MVLQIALTSQLPPTFRTQCDQTQKLNANTCALVFYFKHSFVGVKSQGSDSFTPPPSHTSFSTSLKLTNNNKHILNFGYGHLFTFLSQNASSFYHWSMLSSQKTPFAPMELLEDSGDAQVVSHHLRQEKKSHKYH